MMDGMQRLLSGLAQMHQRLVERAAEIGVTTDIEVAMPLPVADILRDQGHIVGGQIIINGAAVQVVAYTDADIISMFPAGMRG